MKIGEKFSRARTSRFKVLVYGNYVEAFVYEKGVGYNLDGSIVRTEYRGRRSIKEQEIHASSIIRTRNNVIRLVNGNCWQYKDNSGIPLTPMFMTYTFRDHITDIPEANHKFTNYIKRLNWHYFKSKTLIIKYLSVIEFTKIGRVHFHVVFFNLPYIDPVQERKTREFADIWQHGFIEVKIMNNSDNVGAYIAKYMTKAGANKRLLSKKRYFCSHYLKRPSKTTHESTALNMMSEFWEETSVYDNEYISKHYGKVQHRTYKFEPEKLREIFKDYNVGL